MTHDPEPDRDQAAARPSDGFERMRVVAPLLDSLDQALDALGCRNGLHDWDHEFIGDPPDVPNRRLAWSRVDVKCGDCGQRATLQFAPGPLDPVRPDVLKPLTTDQIAQALAAGFAGSGELVQIRALPSSLLWMALRKALDLINADGDPDAWIGSDDQHREWTVRQHSSEGALISAPTRSRRHAEEEIASFEGWHDPDGTNPRPDFRLELVYREVGPWRVAR